MRGENVRGKCGAGRTSLCVQRAGRYDARMITTPKTPRPFKPLLATVMAGATLLTGACASGGEGPRDTAYVARDVETLYYEAKHRLDRGSRHWPPRLFDEVERQHPYSPWARRAQLMSAFSYYVARDYNKSVQASQRFLSDPSGQQGRALRLLPDRAELLRTDQRRSPRPEDHRTGADRLARSQSPLPAHPIRHRRAAEAGPGGGSSGGQGDGNRAVLRTVRPMGWPRRYVSRT